jgi:hypothetical protein
MTIVPIIKTIKVQIEKRPGSCEKIAAFEPTRNVPFRTFGIER